MRVLIDGHMLGEMEGGNERYTKNLAESLQKELEVLVLVKKGYVGKREVLDVKEARLRRQRGGGDWGRVLRDLPYCAKKEEVEVIHVSYIGPLRKTKAKIVVMVHDLSFRRYPEFYSLKVLLQFKYLLPISMRRSAAIVVPSEFVKREMEQYYPQWASKVVVVPEAADKVFRVLGKTERENLKIQAKASDKIVMVMNSENRKKNIQMTVRAVEEMIKEKEKIFLVVIGGRANLKLERLEKLGRVKVVEWISNEELNQYYNDADVLVYSSVYEGFGLPIVEAMQAGLAVVVSDIPVHREVARDGAKYFKLNSRRDLKDKLREVLSNKQERNELVIRGKEVAKTYNWQRTAKMMKKLYQKIGAR